jgi:hypothetical protein
MRINFDLLSPFLTALLRIFKNPGPAVAAAKIAVIGQDQVEVQEILIMMGFPRG